MVYDDLWWSIQKGFKDDCLDFFFGCVYLKDDLFVKSFGERISVFILSDMAKKGPQIKDLFRKNKYNY